MLRCRVSVELASEIILSKSYSTIDIRNFMKSWRMKTYGDEIVYKKKPFFPLTPTFIDMVFEDKGLTEYDDITSFTINEIREIA